jgi:peptidoglycan/LPS O-acetylase OafA/YrhL
MNPWMLAAIAIPLTLIAAMLSWHLVEKRFLASSKKVRGPEVVQATSRRRRRSPPCEAERFNKARHFAGGASVNSDH